MKYFIFLIIKYVKIFWNINKSQHIIALKFYRQEEGYKMGGILNCFFLSSCNSYKFLLIIIVFVKETYL